MAISWVRSSRRRSAALIAAAALSFLADRAGGQVVPRPEQCAKGVIGSIDDIVNAAYDICQAASDCTLPGLDQLSCAGDLTDMMSYWFNLGNKVSTLTLVCGSLDNSCSANVLQALGDISDTSNNFVAAAQDCTTDSWLCAYDIVSAVDTLNYFVGDIIVALQTCNNGAIPPVDFGGTNSDFEEFDVFTRGYGPVDGGYFIERRLKEVPTVSSPSDEPNAAAASGAAVVAQMRENATMTQAQFDETYSQLHDELQRFHQLIEQHKAAAAGAQGGTAEEKRAAWQSLVERVRSHRNGTAAGTPAQSGLGNLAAVAQKLAAAASASSAAAARMPHLQLQKGAEEIHV